MAVWISVRVRRGIMKWIQFGNNLKTRGRTRKDARAKILQYGTGHSAIVSIAKLSIE
jgi:hypothetical protein